MLEVSVHELHDYLAKCGVIREKPRLVDVEIDAKALFERSVVVHSLMVLYKGAVGNGKFLPVVHKLLLLYLLLDWFLLLLFFLTPLIFPC